MSKPLHKMFVAQETLEAWIDSGNVEMRQEELWFRLSGRRFTIQPAVRFVRVIAGAAESNLVGKVLTEERLFRYEGDLMSDSVVFGETALEVVPGFIATEGAASPER